MSAAVFARRLWLMLKGYQMVDFKGSRLRGSYGVASDRQEITFLGFPFRLKKSRK